MATVRSALARNSISVLAVAALVLTSCAAQQPAESDDAGSASTSPSSSPADTATNEGDVLVAEVDDPVEFEVCKEAEQIEGATVEWLEDVVIEEQHIDGVEAQIVELEGQEVEIPGAPGIVIPERVAQAGCIIEYPAPGGCLPAVEISGAFIPGYRIPERRLERFELPDGTMLETAVQPSTEAEAVNIDGVLEEQVCQTESKVAGNTEIVSSVVRPAVVRQAVISKAQLQPVVTRDGVTLESGRHISTMTIPGYGAPAIWSPVAHVNTDHLEAYVVEGADHTEYAERDEVTAYTTEGDVLFDSDDHELRSDATDELEAIADDIAARGDDVTVRVEGHTDNLPSQKYADNAELSERRAESVLQWLTENTDISATNITAEGLGDAHPRASNDSDAGRQQNRRVVITVTPKDYEPKIDYETDSQAPTQ